MVELQQCPGVEDVRITSRKLLLVVTVTYQCCYYIVVIKKIELSVGKYMSQVFIKVVRV